jgi:hypothetical protein
VNCDSSLCLCLFFAHASRKRKYNDIGKGGPGVRTAVLKSHILPQPRASLLETQTVVGTVVVIAMSAAIALADALFGPTVSGRQCFLEYGGAVYCYRFIRNPTQDVVPEQANKDQDRAIWGALNAAEVSDRNIPGCVIIRPYGCRYPTVHFFTILSVGNDDGMAIMRFVNQEYFINPRARTTFDCMCYAEAENPGVWRIEGGWDIMMACFTPNDGVHHFGIVAQFLMTDLVMYVLAEEKEQEEQEERKDDATQDDDLAPTTGVIQFQCRARLKYFDSFLEVGGSRQSLPFVCKFHEELPAEDQLSSDDDDGELENEEEEKAAEQPQQPQQQQSQSQPQQPQQQPQQSQQQQPLQPQQPQKQQKQPTSRPVADNSGNSYNNRNATKEKTAVADTPDSHSEDDSDLEHQPLLQPDDNSYDNRNAAKAKMAVADTPDTPDDSHSEDDSTFEHQPLLQPDDNV